VRRRRGGRGMSCFFLFFDFSLKRRRGKEDKREAPSAEEKRGEWRLEREKGRVFLEREILSIRIEN
jgi:hypothetical protein